MHTLYVIFQRTAHLEQTSLPIIIYFCRVYVSCSGASGRPFDIVAFTAGVIQALRIWGGGGGRTEARYDCVEGNVYVVDWEMALRAVMFCFVCAHGCLGGRNHGDEDFAGSSDGERTWSEKSSNLHQ